MLFYSELFNCYYEADDCICVPNMQQNYKYLQSGKANGQLMDIVCGDNNKILFVWKKSEVTKELYDLWCLRKL